MDFAFGLGSIGRSGILFLFDAESSLEQFPNVNVKNNFQFFILI